MTVKIDNEVPGNGGDRRQQSNINLHLSIEVEAETNDGDGVFRAEKTKDSQLVK